MTDRPPQFRRDRPGAQLHALSIVLNTYAGAATRVRSGTATAGALAAASATGTRTRSGSAYSYTPTPPGTGSTDTGGGVYGPIPYVRWRLDDPVTGASYTFPVNPHTGGSPHAKKTLTTVATTAGDGSPLIFEGDDELDTSQIDGRIRSKAQHDALVLWFAKKRPVQLTDDLGRRSMVALETFKPKRKWSAQAAYRQDYTITYRILVAY